MNYIVTKQTKSKGIAILLVAIFGPLGLFYSSLLGGIIMTLATPIISLILLVKFDLGYPDASLVIVWAWIVIAYIISFLWSVSAVSIYNNKILNEATIFNYNPPVSETKEMIFENLEKIKRLYNDKILPEEDYQRQKDEYLKKLDSIDDYYASYLYQTEYEKMFPNSKNKEVFKNWIITLLFMALIISWVYIIFFREK